MKLKLICDVDIEISIEELSDYLIKLGYIETKFTNKNIRRLKKIYEDDLPLYINIPANKNLSDYERSINLALNLISINEDKSLPLIIKEIKGKELSEYNHTVLETNILL